MMTLDCFSDSGNSPFLNAKFIRNVKGLLIMSIESFTTSGETPSYPVALDFNDRHDFFYLTLTDTI